VEKLLFDAKQRLARAGVDSPALSAQLLVAAALGVERIDLITHPEREIPREKAAVIEGFIARRERGEPVAYILGEKEFFGLSFLVDPAVLIPRPETEQIIELLQKEFDEKASFRFADLGTGSGCLAVTSCVLFPNARGTAVDISPDALALARRNAALHNVENRLAFTQADMRYPLGVEAELDVILTNPPYICEADMPGLSREVREFEPRWALAAGTEGMDLIEAMLPHAAKALKPGGLFLMEIGSDQGRKVEETLKILSTRTDVCFTAVSVEKDLAGLDRIVRALRT
jgi:release factor glutamine methyltransferase